MSHLPAWNILPQLWWLYRDLVPPRYILPWRRCKCESMYDRCDVPCIRNERRGSMPRRILLPHRRWEWRNTVSRWNIFYGRRNFFIRMYTMPYWILLYSWRNFCGMYGLPRRNIW